jgi:hypothetical protein
LENCGVNIKMGKPYIITPGEFEVIRSGSNAQLYLSKTLAIKVPRAVTASGNLNIKTEYKIQEKIYSNGYPVPEPDGIYDVQIEEETGRRCKGFFMERIQGENLEKMIENGTVRNITGKKWKTVRKGALKTIESIRLNLGIQPSDYYDLYPRNIMYDIWGKRIVLIDFGDWCIEGSFFSKIKQFLC